jgi:protocatechuate 3,4-dioxygenase beta subunit
MTQTSGLSRRAALIGLAASSSGLVGTPGRAATGQGAGVCLLTPRSIEGPFYLDPRLVRAEIGEGRPGARLGLRLRVVEAGPCTPIRDARVDVWHADAQGLYSGYTGQGDRERLSTVGQTFLRGTQFSDETGLVRFETIYPGWYPGRATHVHFKVLIERRTLLTGQMYFPDDVTSAIYGAGAYGNRLFKRDTLNGNDFLLRREDPEGRSICRVAPSGDGYLAALTIGVDRRGAQGGSGFAVPG